MTEREGPRRSKTKTDLVCTSNARAHQRALTAILQPGRSSGAARVRPPKDRDPSRHSVPRRRKASGVCWSEEPPATICCGRADPRRRRACRDRATSVRVLPHRPPSTCAGAAPLRCCRRPMARPPTTNHEHAATGDLIPIDAACQRQRHCHEARVAEARHRCPEHPRRLGAQDAERIALRECASVNQYFEGAIRKECVLAV